MAPSKNKSEHWTGRVYKELDILGPDNAFWIDGEWLSWDEIPFEDPEEFSKSRLAELEYQAELKFLFPNADIALVPIFRDLLEIAHRYHHETGMHLQAYGDLGELFGAITYGIKLHKNYAMGSDGRLDNSFVEIKTITPFKKNDMVEIRLDRHFSKVLIVKISADFSVSGRMIDRKDLPRKKGKVLRLAWGDLERMS